MLAHNIFQRTIVDNERWIPLATRGVTRQILRYSSSGSWAAVTHVISEGCFGNFGALYRLVIRGPASARSIRGEIGNRLGPRQGEPFISEADQVAIIAT